jgi:hypothetical protein
MIGNTSRPSRTCPRIDDALSARTLMDVASPPTNIGHEMYPLYLDAVDCGPRDDRTCASARRGEVARLSSSPFTPAMLVVGVGVLVDRLALDAPTLRPSSSTVLRLAEVTLAVVLFSDASRINLRALRREAPIPVRLLGVGLPLTIVLGTLVALTLFGLFSLSDALILGVIFAPTGAGIGSAVVTDTRLPQRVGQSLSVESGLTARSASHCC